MVIIEPLEPKDRKIISLAMTVHNQIIRRRFMLVSKYREIRVQGRWVTVPPGWMVGKNLPCQRNMVRTATILSEEMMENNW